MTRGGAATGELRVASPHLVSLRGVTFAYPLPGGGARPALRGIDFDIRPGESVVVLGANGAGKSSLAALLAGVALPTAGDIVRAVPAAAGGHAVLPVGLVTQNPEDCFSSPVVREEMGVVLENLERAPAEIDRAVGEALDGIGLAGHADAHPATLSGGQKQLLAIASVLIAEPPLLVLDEPLSLLDAPGRAEVDRLLERRRGPAAATVYLTSEVEDASRGGRTVILHRGAVVWQGPSAEMPQEAGTLVAWDLLPPEPAGAAGGESEGNGGTGGAVAGYAQRRVPEWRQDPGACTEAEGPWTTRPPAPGIVVEGLHFSYDPGTPRERPVLRGVDLEARAGKFLGIVGAIGSGKTTLIRHLNGLLSPQRGRVTVGARVLETGAKTGRILHREVGLVFQFPEKQLFAETVAKDVAAGPEFAGVPGELVPARVRAALERVGLDPADCGPRPPFGLTWGEQRLVAIAGVLALDTPHLVLDEPGVGLDPATRRRTLGLLADLAHRGGRTVVVVSHHLDDLFRVADRIAVLHAGRIVFSGAPASLAGSGDLARWGLAPPVTPRRLPPRS